MIANALAARLPKDEASATPCHQCNQVKEKRCFPISKWHTSSPVCLTCQPIEDRFRKKAKESKVCAGCGVDKQRSDYTERQWAFGNASKCRGCVEAGQLSRVMRTRVCVKCGVEKPKGDFSPTQWISPARLGAKCKSCCDENLKMSQERLRDKKKPTAMPIENIKEEKEKALRWVMEAEESELPSVSNKSWSAMNVLNGKAERAQSWDMKPDESGIAVVDKLAFLKTCHDELSHLGGRDAIVKALKEEGKWWTNLSIDAQWVVLRCEDGIIPESQNLCFIMFANDAVHVLCLC